MSNCGEHTASNIGKLIVFEGVDRAGKSTLLEQTYLELTAKGHKVVKFKNLEDDSVTGSAIRKILNTDKDQYIDALRMGLLYSSELHYQFHKKNGIIEHIQNDYIVLLDRSIYSTYVYAHKSDILPDILNKFSKKLHKEVLLIYVKADMKSINKRGDDSKRDLYESSEKIEEHAVKYVDLFYDRVGPNPFRNDYITLGKEDNFLVADNSADGCTHMVVKEICNHIENKILGVKK